jgi:hypothetical protein
MNAAESKLAAVLEHGISRPIEMSGYGWQTVNGEYRIRAPWKHGTMWATFEIIEPTTVVEEPNA